MIKTIFFFFFCLERVLELRGKARRLVILLLYPSVGRHLRQPSCIPHKQLAPCFARFLLARIHGLPGCASTCARPRRRRQVRPQRAPACHLYLPLRALLPCATSTTTTARSIGDMRCHGNIVGHLEGNLHCEPCHFEKLFDTLTD